MPLIESESLILKSYNLSEADKIVVFISREYGVIRGVAKGARRLQSRFGSSLEPFSLVKTSYLQKDAVELVNIQNVDLIDSSFASASELEFLQKFSYLAELLIALSPPHDPNETLYRMAKTTVKAAVDNPTNLLATGVYFEAWLLKLSGLLPDWTKCSQCGAGLEDHGDAGVQANFHLLCSTCQRGGRTRNVGAVERYLLTSALRLHPQEFIKISADHLTHLELLSRNLKYVISAAVGRDVSERRVLSRTGTPA
jgi:DNA repair protein RecO (recombination protein O)